MPSYTLKGNAWAVGLFSLAALICAPGCGGGGSGGGDTQTPSLVNLGGDGFGNGNNPVGTATCIQCHYAFPSDYFTAGDPFDSRSYFDAGAGIGVNYQKGVHGETAPGSGTPQCEDCHGSGGQHFGTGPIPHPAPDDQQCNKCHSDHVAPWLGTDHANQAGQGPDQFFFEGTNGSAPAHGKDGLTLFAADGVTPITKDQKIEECSGCHSYSQDFRPAHIDQLTKNPPAVSCPACHDAHAPSLQDRPVLRTRPGGVDPALMLRLKPVKVNNDITQPQYGARNDANGTWIRPTLWYPFAMATVSTDPGYLTGTTPPYGQNITTLPPSGALPAGIYTNVPPLGIPANGTYPNLYDPLRTTSERLCASCHSQGTWKYTRFDGTAPYTNTHNQDIYHQYLQAGHAAIADQPYTFVSAYGNSSVQYPYDLGKLPSPFTQPLYSVNTVKAPTSDPTKDGRISGGSDRFLCFQCHNGIGSITYLKGQQGGLDAPLSDTSNAHILMGDCSTTCITCHDPHASAGASTDGTSAADHNVRIPVYMSYNQFFNDLNNPGSTTANRRGGLKGLMMDGTPIPTGILNTPSQICIFCHQGRDSGYTQYRKYSQLGFDFFTNTTATTNGTMNVNITGTSSPTGSVVSPGNGHHFNAGGTLWSRNAAEFTWFSNGGATATPAQYSDGIPAHQAMNCVGCHMGPVTDTAITNTTTGGHTFKPSTTVCLTCHSSSDINNVTLANGAVSPFVNVPIPAALKDVDGDSATTTVYQTIGDYNGINWKLWPSPKDPGLFNKVRYAFFLNHILWNNGSYYVLPTTFNGPPFNTLATGNTTANTNITAYYPAAAGLPANPNSKVVTNWTEHQMQAAWNIDTMQNANDGLAVYTHNFYYVAQLLIDSCQGLGMTANPGADPNSTSATYVWTPASGVANGGSFNRPTTPPAFQTYPAGTTRPATNYSQIKIP